MQTPTEKRVITEIVDFSSNCLLNARDLIDGNKLDYQM